MGDNQIEKLYFGFLLLLPIVFSTSIIDPVLIPRQILLTFFLLAIIMVLIWQKKAILFPFKTPLFLAITVFLTLNFIALFTSNIAGESHAVLSKLAVLFTFFLLTTLLLYNNLIRLNQLIVAVIVFGVISLFFSFFDIINKAQQGQHLLRKIEVIKGTSANKNLLSSILFLCLPFYFTGLQQGKTMRFLSIGAILSTLFVLITVRTRVVLLACFIFFTLLICYKIKEHFTIKKRYFLISGISVLLLLFGSYKFYLENKIANLKSSSTDITQQYLYRLSDSKTLESRILFWENSMQMAKENPLLGVGLGNWQILFPKYGLNRFDDYATANGESTLQRPHNDFIWILCETGILGLLAYLMIFGAIFYQLYSLIKSTTDSKEKWKFFFILSTLIGYLVIAFFDFPYERIEHQVIVMLLLAIVASAYCKSVAYTTKNYKSWLWLLLVPIGYSFLVSFYRFNGEQHAVKMYAARANKNWSETIYETQKANHYFYPLDNTSMPLTWYEGIAHFNENRIVESQICFEKAYQLTPYNIQVITNLASTYQANGKIEEAVALYNDALKISKEFDEAKLNLAALYYNKKEFDKAYALINEIKVTSKNPKYKLYLVPILNHKINAYLKTATDKVVIENLVKNVTTKEALLQLFFDAKKKNMAFETYLAQAKFK
ncbi:tetratricopeptide repeat protein [Flavobacterium sp. IMCC34852]|uniref:Tetratricopeptide repeat protein n=1 Tax=Flavobacterium rivulicola TaxID=2732161 RepID=A0A7Y3VXL9_9FLAO|nr:O-antigen ligase family protein [Flavobacterium sp. IMCC34852]NNT70774.1 tetratricopeptide repeat protein [Flavobacterium sp. IMCC34852]